MAAKTSQSTKNKSNVKEQVLEDVLDQDMSLTKRKKIPIISQADWDAGWEEYYRYYHDRPLADALRKTN